MKSVEKRRKNVGAMNSVEKRVEKTSKKFDTQWSGRSTQNTVVVFPKETYQIGDFVDVKINECTSATLIGIATGYSKKV